MNAIFNERLRPVLVLLPIALVTACADLMLWRKPAGISLGICFAVIATLLLCFRRTPLHPGRTLFFGGLMVVSIAQAAVEISFSNILVLSICALLIAAEAMFGGMSTLWSRISEVMFGICTAPLRWFPVGMHIARIIVVPAKIPAALSVLGGGIRTTFDAARVVAPTIIVVAIFTAVFAQGNAIFAEILHATGTNILEWITSIDLSPPRFLFWAVIATLALGLFHGRSAPDHQRWWTFTLPRFSRSNTAIARLQCLWLLVALNILFAFVNTIDVIYLWRSGQLPRGISHSTFVHAGVWSLITAVILSAVVIAGIFQQRDEVVEHRSLKVGGYIWIGQNGILIAGVFYRLYMYIDECLWTEKRVYVGVFLALVTTGFGLLAWFIEKRKSFNWLLGRCSIATFVVFFLIQIPNVGGWVAQANVQRWKSNPHFGLDVKYLASLGPGAWPALMEVAQSREGSPARDQALRAVHKLSAQEEIFQRQTDWRSWQYRRNASASWFIARNRTLIPPAPAAP